MGILLIPFAIAQYTLRLPTNFLIYLTNKATNNSFDEEVDQFKENFPTEYELIKLQYIKTTRDTTYAILIDAYNNTSLASPLPEEANKEQKQAAYNQIHEKIYGRDDTAWLDFLESSERNNPIAGMPSNPNFSVNDEINKLVIETGFNRLRLIANAFRRAIKLSNNSKTFLLTIAAMVITSTTAIIGVMNKYVVNPLFTVLAAALVFSPLALLALLVAPLYVKDFVINLGQRKKQERQEPMAKTAQPVSTAEKEKSLPAEQPRHFPSFFVSPTAAEATTTLSNSPTSGLGCID